MTPRKFNAADNSSITTALENVFLKIEKLCKNTKT